MCDNKNTVYYCKYKCTIVFLLYNNKKNQGTSKYGKLLPGILGMENPQYLKYVKLNKVVYPALTVHVYLQKLML